MSDDMNEDESRSSFFPTRSSATEWQAGPVRVLEIGDEESRPVFAALSSETARAILSMVFDEPRTASTLAEEAGTSIQNAKYHLEKLEEQRLVEVVDTRYSSRGVEMAVYGPKNAAIVLFAGEVPDRTATTDLFRRPVGAVALLTAASVLVELVARRSARGPTTQGDSVVEITRQFAAEPIAIDLGVVDVSPGTLFLLGGLFVFALGLATRRIEGA